jgi:hypothetical protein
MYPANSRLEESGSPGLGAGTGAEAGTADDFIAYKPSLSLRFLDAPGVKIRRGWKLILAFKSCHVTSQSNFHNRGKKLKLVSNGGKSVKKFRYRKAKSVK